MERPWFATRHPKSTQGEISFPADIWSLGAAELRYEARDPKTPPEGTGLLLAKLRGKKTQGNFFCFSFSPCLSDWRPMLGIQVLHRLALRFQRESIGDLVGSAITQEEPSSVFRMTARFLGYSDSRSGACVQLCYGKLRSHSLSF